MKFDYLRTLFKAASFLNGNKKVKLFFADKLTQT